MSTATVPPEIIFPEGYYERRELETPMKGWLDDVIVQLEDGSRYKLFFYDPVRLQQDLEEDAREGTPYLAEPNLIVLPEVTTASIKDVVCQLARKGYFKQLKPL